MALHARFDELTVKHRALDRRIQEEMARPLADSLEIAALKRQKLRIKDELARLGDGHSQLG